MFPWPEQRVSEIGEQILFFQHGNGEMGIANAACLIQNGRALVIDTMLLPEMARRMREELNRRDLEVEMVLNTHHHLDHLGGNQVFADRPLIGHDTSINFFRQVGLPPNLEALFPRFRGQFGELTLTLPEPALETLSLPEMGELLVLGPAHTIVDLAVWLPKQRVLLSGDLCFVGVTPLAVHGLVSGWCSALKTLIALRPEIVLPGHGPVGGLTDLQNMEQYFSSLLTLAQQALKGDITPYELLKMYDPTPKDWSEPERTQLNLQRAIQELRGEIHRQHLPPLFAR